MKPGEVRMWLDQGPAVLLETCEVEAEALTPLEYLSRGRKIKTEQGWIIKLLKTGEVLSVHEDTLHTGGCT